MLENAVFSVITPDGCASILWKDPSRVVEAVECLRITAEDMKAFGVADEIIPESGGFEGVCEAIREKLSTDFKSLSSLTPEELTEKRYQRYRRLGAYIESNQ